MAQVIISYATRGSSDDEAFERKLAVIRKLAEQRIRYGGKIPGGKWFDVSSLSARTITYKLHADVREQVEMYYADLREEELSPRWHCIAFFHQHVPEPGPGVPHRFIAHNGNQHVARHVN